MGRKGRIEPGFDPPSRRKVTAAPEEYDEPAYDGRSGGPPDDPFEPPRKARRTWPFIFLFLFGWIAIFGTAFVARWIDDIPDISGLMGKPTSHDVTILDVKGRFIARRGLTQGQLVDATRLPPHVTNAFIAIEDRRFRNHFGIDAIGLLRAARVNLIEGRVVQGGSTITQQLAKNLFLKPSRTFERKLQEAGLALYLEQRYSKDELLTLYLNRVYFGAGVYGLEAAAERFFDKPARALTLIESAMLAGSLKAPARYNPLANADASVARGKIVLSTMRDAGLIAPEQAQMAMIMRPRIVHGGATASSGYFVDWILANLADAIGETDEPLLVHSTLDLDMQEEAERMITSALAQQGSSANASEAALVAMTPDGQVRAMMGGRSYSATPFNRVTDAWRQPGSAFKPIVYLAALERGRSIEQTVMDRPVHYGKWSPRNYESRYEGEISLTRAFAKSSNAVAVQLAKEVGPRSMIATARKLGITAKLDPVLALSLGVSVMTPLELTQAYAPFANGGSRVSAFGVSRIETRSGSVLYRRHGSGLGRAMSPDHAAVMNKLMQATVTIGTGKAARLADRPTAGKTGTTQNYHDAWFIGFTGNLVCGVWFGNDDSSPMTKVTGGGLPARVFHAFMTTAEKNLPIRDLPGMATIPPAEDQPPQQIIADPQAAAHIAPQPLPSPEDSETKQADAGDGFDSLLDRLFGG